MIRLFNIYYPIRTLILLVACSPGASLDDDLRRRLFGQLDQMIDA